jgi:hypothetical protein
MKRYFNIVSEKGDEDVTTLDIIKQITEKDY